MYDYILQLYKTDLFIHIRTASRTICFYKVNLRRHSTQEAISRNQSEKWKMECLSLCYSYKWSWKTNKIIYRKYILYRILTHPSLKSWLNPFWRVIVAFSASRPLLYFLKCSFNVRLKWLYENLIYFKMFIKYTILAGV